MSKTIRKAVPERLRTYGRSRAVRHPDCDYAGGIDVHLTICAVRGRPFEDTAAVRMVCENIEFYSHKSDCRLYGYCLMPDHLHVLLSPSRSDTPIARWLREFKSYTTRQHQWRSGQSELWQRSAHDHVCRQADTAETVLAYIVNNPVRAGLVERWEDWPWTKVFIEL